MNRDNVADGLQIAILLGMGGLAGAASFRHVHDLAADHGQAGWFAWATAVSIEAMSIAAGLEIRRSHRTNHSARFPTVALAGGIAVSLAAQVAQAQRSPWGWIVAAMPAVAFLTVLKFALRRLDTAPAIAVVAPAPETAATEAKQEIPEPTRGGSVAEDLAAFLATN